MFYNGKQIKTLSELNYNLLQLNSQTTGMSSDMFDRSCQISDFLNKAIENSTLSIYENIKRKVIIDAVNEQLTSLVKNEEFKKYVFDEHGVKHFENSGKMGTKFLKLAAIVNPILEKIISQYKEEIRNAKDSNQFYLKVKDEHNICPENFKEITIQLEYDRATDTVTYHGYPDWNNSQYGLSITKY